MNLQEILKQQLLIIESLDILPSGKVRFGGKAGGIVDVELENPIGDRRRIRARCGSDCPPGKVQLVRLDTGEYVAFSPSVARDLNVSSSTTRVVSKKQKLVKKEDEEFWPVTSCFLYFEVDDAPDVVLDNNGATQGDETSWDAIRELYASPSQNSRSYGFGQRFDTLGDYETLDDALLNKLKPDRLIVPTGGGSASAAKDNVAWGSGAAEAVIIWFYVGNPATIISNGKIFKVEGPPTHPSTGNVTAGGPGFAMEVYRGGGISSAIFPNENIGSGPLTKKLKEDFVNLGGRIGYAGRIERWRGMQDYTTEASVYYFRNTPSSSQTPQTPTTFPPGYVPGSNNPWLQTNSAWFRFGWPDPQFIGCASTSWVNVNTTAISGIDCGANVASNQWYWGGDASPDDARIDKDNSQGYIGTTGIFVCWQGHKDNASLAQSFFEAFRVYWGIAGSVTRLGSVNPYGCEIPNSGGDYPPAPTNNVSRFYVRHWGRKAKVFLKVCHQDLDALKIELPFQFAAIVTKKEVLGGGSFAFGSNFESNKIWHRFQTYGYFEGGNLRDDPMCLENPHATLTIVKESDSRLYAIINLFYGAIREWKEPLENPIRPFLSNAGYGNIPGIPTGDFMYARFPSIRALPPTYVEGNPTQVENHALLKRDRFHCCRFFKVRLPNKEDKTLTIVADRKYKLGENEDLLTELQPNNPDNEFNNKWLIADFRTDLFDELLAPTTTNQTRITAEKPYYASFGGLPALIQFSNWPTATVGSFRPLWYKNKNDWSELDWVYYWLQEAPRQYNPLTTILPQNVFPGNHPELTNVIFDFDKRFGRHGRAELIMPSTNFGSGGDAPSYTLDNVIAHYPLFIAFQEQLVGNGLKDLDGNLTTWFRVTPSSFPILHQLLRNTPY